MRRSGLALLLVVGVLGVLAALAAAFVTLARLERRASQQRLYGTQALLLARSGLEDALARLATGQTAAYGGEDWNGDGNLDAFELQQEAFQPGTPNIEDCPARHALRPSFFADDGLGNPQYRPVDGRLRSRSGSLQAGEYAFKALPQAGFFVNGGDPAAPPTEGYNAVLRRMLGTLAEAFDREDGLDDAKPVDETDGWKLMDQRPAGGWISFDQVAAALGKKGTEVLKPSLCLHAWVDRKVVRPNAVPALDGQAFTCWADIKTAHGGPPGLEARAPVNLSWARSRKPVLLALLSGLRGLYLDESTATPLDAGDRIGTLRPAELRNTWSASDPCHRIAETLLSSTSELATWDQWNAFCDALPDAILTGTTDARQAARDILKANFNPNTDLNKFNPSPSLWRSADKSDLLSYSTEFSLLPLHDHEIEAVGRLLGPEGTLLAARTVRATVSGPSALRVTAQSEFAASDLGSLERAGDEAGPRLEGDPLFLTESAGPGRTFKHTALAGTAGNYLDGDSLGLSLQTLPEPLPTAPAPYDGQVQLATVDTADGAFVPAGGAMTLLARWDAGLDADTTATSGDPAHLPDLEQPGAAQPVWGNPDPGTRYPDGLYIEKDRQPGYAALGNMHGKHGALSFWLKPGCDALKGPGRLHLYVNHTRTSSPSGGSDETATFLIANAFQSGGALGNLWFPFGFGFQWESAYGPDMDPSNATVYFETAGQTPERPIPPRRWHLLSCCWNMEEADPSLARRLFVDAGTLPADNDTVIYGTSLAGSCTVDFAQPDAAGPSVFCLGRRGNEPKDIVGVFDFGWWGAPDATFDEFAVYDFGPDGVGATQALAQTRFPEGRYYKESAYAGLSGSPGLNMAGRWFSAPVDLGRAHVRGLAWTPIVPGGLQSPADPGSDARVLLELADPGGSDYALDAGGRKIDALLSDPALTPVHRDVAAPFRLHAVFQPNLEDPENTPILDPLALDDITVVYVPASGPAVLTWQEGG